MLIKSDGIFFHANFYLEYKIIRNFTLKLKFFFFVSRHDEYTEACYIFGISRREIGSYKLAQMKTDGAETFSLFIRSSDIQRINVAEMEKIWIALEEDTADLVAVG